MSFRFRPDPYTSLIVGMVLLATLLPVRGDSALAFGWLTNGMIALLFFLHGARLSRAAVVAGATHWRLHLVILASTFVLFPALGLAIHALPEWILPASLSVGMLFLCCLPSTVQSSIAFTSIAGGNVPAAVCAASLSNILGVFVSPLLVGLLLSVSGRDGISLDSIETIVLQLFVPFVAGQILQPWIGDWVRGRRRLVMSVDRGSILMVVYGAFSEAVMHGLWQTLPIEGLAVMIVADVILLAVVMTLMTVAARRLGFSREDEITILFCGSKKSLASGVPIANALFAGPTLGMIVLPLMFFHQIQLMVCAVLARRYAATAAKPQATPLQQAAE